MIEVLGDAVGVLALAAVVGVGLYDRLTEEPDEIEKTKQAWVNDEISLGEYERRLERDLDPETDLIREAVEPISGISSSRGKMLAEYFDSLEELRNASKDELMAVPNIGDEYADAIQERLE